MEPRIIKNTTILLVALVAIISGLLSGCYYDVEEDLYPLMSCDTSDVSYAMDIIPILDGQCYVCHNTATQTGGVFFEEYQDILVYVGNGNLLCAIKQEDGCTPMPDNGPKMFFCDINKIEKWINDGAPEN